MLGLTYSIDTTVQAFNGGLKIFDDTFASIKYKKHHKNTVKPEIGASSCNFFTKAVTIVKDEKETYMK